MVRTPGWDALLDCYIDAERRLMVRAYDRKRDGWRASGFGYCIRTQVLKRAGVPETREIDAKTRRTFKWGDEVHKFVKTMFWRYGLMVADEVPFAAGSLTGHLDALVGGPPRPVDAEPAEKKERWSPEWLVFLQALRDELVARFGDAFDQPTGIEIKSAHSFAMKKIMKEGPYAHHVQQIAAAALAQKMGGGRLMLRDETSVQVGRWRLMYVGKDAVGTLTFDLPGGSIQKAADRLEALDAAWASGALPACECAELDQVNWCNYPDFKGKTKTKIGCCGVDDDDRLADLLAKSLAAVGV
jgi:hypothetical protein